MGHFEVKEPKVLKVTVRPALIVPASADPAPLVVRAQNAPQASSNIPLVNQAEPNTSFHPFLKGLQHALGPHRTFHPVPPEQPGVSRLLSLSRHCHGSSFVGRGPHPTTSLRPFAPRALPPFLALMGALTPARLALRRSARELHPPTKQVSPGHMTRPSMHSVTKHLTRPVIASALPAQRDRLPISHLAVAYRSGLHLESAGSSQRTAESCSSSYGLHVRLRLLPTPPRGDAVTFGYRDRASPEGGLSPPKSRLLPGARIPACAGMTSRWSALTIGGFCLRLICLINSHSRVAPLAPLRPVCMSRLSGSCPVRLLSQ